MKRILIADDNPMVRLGLRDLIEHNQEWDVCGEAINGLEAIEQARALSPGHSVAGFSYAGDEWLRHRPRSSEGCVRRWKAICQ